MPNRKKVERSANYSYYSDLLWCTCLLYTSPSPRDN